MLNSEIDGRAEEVGLITMRDRREGFRKEVFFPGPGKCVEYI